jgi:hypothetical protein
MSFLKAAGPADPGFEFRARRDTAKRCWFSVIRRTLFRFAPRYLLPQLLVIPFDGLLQQIGQVFRQGYVPVNGNDLRLTVDVGCDFDRGIVAFGLSWHFRRLCSCLEVCSGVSRVYRKYIAEQLDNWRFRHLVIR